MQTFKPNEAELPELVKAAKLLKQANGWLAGAKKSAEAAKATLAKWLAEQRKVEVEQLAVGEVVHIDGVCMLQRASMRKFDVKSFELAHATLHAEFSKDTPYTKYTPVV